MFLCLLFNKYMLTWWWLKPWMRETDDSVISILFELLIISVMQFLITLMHHHQRALWSWNSSICQERNNFFKLTFWYSICRKTATATWFYVKDFRFHIRSVVLYSLTIFPQGQYFVGIFVFNIWMQGLLMKECLLRRNIFMICALLFKVFRKMLLNWE